jgi:two-component system, NarL family, nitrate/nitrite response regulator NarL
MRTITMTYVSSRKTARVECDRLVEQNPDIELVALTSGVDSRDVWLALSRSEIAVIDEEIMHYDDGGETLGVLLAGNPGVKFLAVMKNFNEDRMLWAIIQGVRGVILRRELLQLLGKAIRRVHQGEVWMPRDLLNSFRGAITREEPGLVGMESAAINPRLKLH